MAGRDTDSPTLPHFIDGERVAGESNRFGDVYDPATGRVRARAPFATAVANGVDSINVRRPLGVCARITPFNTEA